MKELQGIYFNGITSKQIDVKVELDYKHLIISSLIESDNVHESWNIRGIKNVDFSSAKLLQLQYGEKPQQTLLIEDSDGYNLIKSQYPDLIKQNIYHRLLKLNSIKVIGFSLIVLASVLFLYFAFIPPYVSQKIVDIVPIKEEIKLGDKAAIDTEEGNEQFDGTVVWTSSEAEFTPKNIQTKKSRANLVYAVKVKIDNSDNKLKIGMPVFVTMGE